MEGKEDKDKLKKQMKVDYSYPLPNDKNFQSKIFKKREFYYHKLPGRSEMKTYEDIKDYRDKLCSRNFALYEHQALLSNYINPDTPYKGVLIFHGTGTGKCLTEDQMVYINGDIMMMKDVWKIYKSDITVQDDEDEYGEWALPIQKLFVNSLDNNTMKIKRRPVKRLYRQKISETINVVELNNGSKVEITKRHKLYTEVGWTNSFKGVNYVLVPNRVINANTTSIGNQVARELGVSYKEEGLPSNSLPSNLMNAQKDEIRTFLMNFFGDNVEGRCWLIDNKSKKVIQQFSTLLRYFSVNTRLVLSKDNQPILEVEGDNVFKKVYIPSEKNKDFVFVQIKSITEKFYNGYVYDLEVEEHHSFVVEGVLASNTCAGIAIAEKFKQMVQKYGTKIYVLVSGPLVKENWKKELIQCTGETYLSQVDQTSMVTNAEKNKTMKNAISTAMQYYRFMSYRSFYRKVLGEKIREGIRTNDDKIKTVYRKTKEGDFERDIAIDRIMNLNNTLLIVDEAHHLTGNNYGDALMKIIKNSYNLKVVLLSATPMKNLAEDIIGLLNFLRPVNEPIQRDKVFTSNKNYLMDFKPGGLEYFKKMATGYVSYLRGADPLTFAKRVELGVVPKGLLFTPIVQCKMLPFQQKAYDEAVKEVEDTLDRKSAAVANFAIPGLSDDRKDLVGLYGRKGIIEVKNQVKTHFEKLNKKIGEEVLKIDTDKDLINISDNEKTITGEILKSDNLKHFSIKFYTALQNLNRLFHGDKGARTAFVYSNLVKVGIEPFEEILKVNGYLEFDEDPSNYKIKPDTICYYCGKPFSDHKAKEMKKLAEGSVDKKDDHEFHPATYISVTGKSTEDVGETIPEEKKNILDNYFSIIQNKEGKLIKFVLGSKVMSEAISLKNVAEVHILDVYFNLGQVDQVIGRAIRGCSHYGIINDKNRYPEVLVYKYAVTLKDGLSSEEELYRKAEHKYIMIKKAERALKETAIDCPLLRNGNIFPEELSKYKNCVVPENKRSDKDVVCPALCDYLDCNFKCEGDNLNRVYFDSKTNEYKSLSKEDLDYNTFTKVLAKNEIDYVKNKIKELFRIRYVYKLDYIVKYVKKSYSKDKAKLFDDFFVYKALDELIPVTENDFNNFKDTIFDKYNKPGYLIYIDKYYIFQPFDQNEDVPMYYRSTYDRKIETNLTLFNYLKSSDRFKELQKRRAKGKKTSKDKVITAYKFDTDYYDRRPEYKFVGIIDKESARRKNKSLNELVDVFKIREKRSKILEKKRGTGIPSFKGAVCTSKEKGYGEKVAKNIGIKISKNETRNEICNKIRDRMIFLEKYSSGKNKMTYIMVPENHKTIPFPLNIEDRLDSILAKIKDKIKFKIEIKKVPKKTKVQGESVTTYELVIKKDKNLEEFSNFFKAINGKDEKGKIVIKIE